MKLFIPTEDPVMDSDAPAELPIPLSCRDSGR
jgi:hypothetical protein